MVTRGFDHLASTLYARWIEVSSENTGRKIVRTVQVTGIPEAWTLGQPRIALAKGQWRATIDGTNTHVDPLVDTRWMPTSGEPGVVRVRSGTR